MHEQAFWDTSALVPLCVSQNASPAVRALFSGYSIVVWWATPVEMCSAFARLARMGLLDPAGHNQARARQEQLQRNWRQVQPLEPLRKIAESLLERFPLRAADAMQLAAALTWSRHAPRDRAFISGDIQLLEAAQSIEFYARSI